MRVTRQFGWFLKSRIGRSSLLLVLTSGLILGYLVCRTFVNPLPPKYTLDFGNARWIEPREMSPHVFFRKEVFLPDAVRQAWIQVAATDLFELSINGRTLPQEEFVSTRVAGLYDLKTHLQPGKNVIGVRVERKSYPGSSQLCVRATVKGAGGNWTEILSDETWKAASDTATVPAGTAWNSPLLGDTAWATAKLSDVGRHSLIQQVDFNPRLLELAPEGEWIAAPAANDRQRSFFTRIDLPRGSQETWLQVAATGAYDLVINGDPVATESIPDQAGIIQRTIGANTVIPALQAFYITPWLRKGSNEILIRVRPERSAVALLADGFTVGQRGEIQRIKTDASWHTMEKYSASHAAGAEHAVTLARYGQPPMGILEQRMAGTRSLPLYDVKVATGWLSAMLPSVALALFLWFCFSQLVAKRTRLSLPRALARDALVHLPLIGGMIIVLLLRYDIRLTEKWSFQPIFVLLFLCSLVAVRLFHPILAASTQKRLTLRSVGEGVSRYAYPIALAAIIVLGFAVRYHDMSYCSFDHDEIGVIDKSQGIFDKGFPYHMVGSKLKPLTTYELVPYPLALSSAIFGYSEWSMRLPACLFGTATILLIGIMARRMFNWPVAVVASLLYACLPLNIRWSQNAFYPSQAQFFSVLLFWTFYEAIQTRPFHRRYLTVAAIAFCCTYLSWEGSGFLLPALFVALLATRWGEWWWLKDSYLYKCLFFMCVVVIAQLCYRTLSNDPYLMIGSGLSTVSTPSLFFLNASYNPGFYIQKLLLGENHVAFTLVTVIGVVFCWRSTGIRYCVVMMAALLACYTNLLSADSPRYCYIYQPLLLISAVAILFRFIEQLVALTLRTGQNKLWTRFAYANGFLAIGILFICSNSWVLKAYRLSYEPEDPSMNYRMGTYRVDYRSADLFVKDNMRPGDVVIPGIPHAYEYYTGRSGNYFLNTLLSSRLWYDSAMDEPRYLDKFCGLPVLRSLKELQDVTHRAGRTWIIFAPTGYFMANQPEVLQYINDNTRVMYQSYNSKVLLFDGATQPAPVQSAQN